MTVILAQLPKCWDFKFESAEVAKRASCSRKGRKKTREKIREAISCHRVFALRGSGGGGGRQKTISVDRVPLVGYPHAKNRCRN